jgi:hypothetical protein
VEFVNLAAARNLRREQRVHERPSDHGDVFRVVVDPVDDRHQATLAKSLNHPISLPS